MALAYLQEGYIGVEPITQRLTAACSAIELIPHTPSNLMDVILDNIFFNSIRFSVFTPRIVIKYILTYFLYSKSNKRL